MKIYQILIQKSLCKLEDYMDSIDYNKTTFNGFIRLQMDSRNARVDISIDILIKLFKGYLSAPDKKFDMYIKQKKNEYEVMAESKYKSLVRRGK